MLLTGVEKNIKFADVVSGGDGMKMVGVPDNTPDVSYRTAPKGWMSQRVFREYLGGRRAMNGDRHGREEHTLLDNCTSHLDEDQCENEFARLKARLVYFPANATDLCQPADSFVIAKIKYAWRRK
ncbi:hypothetical protein PHMEG_00011231 [Phytophthora megakarya]|uniref:DDE-1 domain-containing protein n=1 Tax=Phytophthora megakarya TaxID=4795 RepID=A0A225WD38_9STRA|nr:hypothetical protein PHMEG_00011231 [Phytophthora megakarya]